MSDKLTIACDTKRLPDIRQFIGNVLAKNQLDEVEAHKLILAVDEICANLIIHANDSDPSKELNVIVDVKPGKIVFTIKDKGKSFDITKYKAPSMDHIVTTGRKGGLGLILVRRIMDDIQFSTEKNCNICKLVKNR